jgi:hypothetical protein
MALRTSLNDIHALWNLEMGEDTNDSDLSVALAMMESGLSRQM